MKNPGGKWSVALIVLAFVCGASAWAQSLEGMVDIHIHCDPDSVPRAVDGFDVAMQARAANLGLAGSEALSTAEHASPQN